MSSDAIVDAVRAKLAARSERGVSKYGVTMERTDLSQAEWLTHLQEELLDAAVYVERILREVMPTDSRDKSSATGMDSHRGCEPATPPAEVEQRAPAGAFPSFAAWHDRECPEAHIQDWSHHPHYRWKCDLKPTYEGRYARFAGRTCREVYEAERAAVTASKSTHSSCTAVGPNGCACPSRVGALGACVRCGHCEHTQGPCYGKPESDICPHGRDPWDRCDECGTFTSLREAMAKYRERREAEPDPVAVALREAREMYELAKKQGIPAVVVTAHDAAIGALIRAVEALERRTN